MFIERAFEGDNAPWKVFLTFMVSGGIFLLNLLVFLIVPSEMLDYAYAQQEGPPSVPMFIMTLLPFAFLLIILLVLVRHLHGRSWMSLTTTRKKFDFGRFFTSLFTVVLITALTVGLEYYQDPESMVWSLNIPRFLIFLVIALVLLPFQIGYEEYFFRGFLMQQIGILSKNRWIPLLSTSVFFGICHAANPEIREIGPLLLVYYIGTGLFLGILTLADEGLELPLGYHLGNNLMAALLVGYDHAALQSETILRYSHNPDPNEMLRNMLISVGILYPLLLLFFKKRYQWGSLKEKLFGPIQPKIVKLSSDDAAQL